MKKLLLLLFCLVAVVAHGTVTFDATKKYRLVSNLYGSGYMALGANHGSTALVYYVSTSTTTDADGYWYIEKSGNGYAIRNASTSQYLYHEPTREDGVAKGLRLRSDVSSDSARWTLTASGTSFYITNVAAPSQYLNLRTDGTNLVGTYEELSTLSSNELFAIYDEDGNQVTDDGNTEGNKEDQGDTGDETHGISEGGAYWELTGLSQPVVYTTDTSNPVLYSIRNVRKGNYVYVNTSYDYLYQTADEASAAKFYFVEGSDGVNVYTQDGYYVQTSSYSWGGQSYVYATQGTTTTSTNIFAFGFYQDDTYPGYYLKKTTDTSGNNWGWGGPGGGQSTSTSLYWNDYNGTQIGFYSLDGGSTFVFESSDERHLEYLKENGITFGDVTAKQSFRNVVDSIRFDQKDLVYRKDTKTYMFNIRPKFRGGKTYSPVIDVKFKEPDKGYTFRIDSVAMSAKNVIDIDSVNATHNYQLQVWDADTIIASSTLNFTFLPIVEINVASCNGSYYTTGSIRVNYYQADGYDSTYIAAFKYRGASAQNYSKKSYAVKLYDADGNSVDRKFIGYRSDNNWILDAMAVDKSCMRNRVSFDLWNDFAADPYYIDKEPKARTGTRGRFVEVLLNGSYQGLYCMTEKIDRKQMKLKKFVSTEDGAPADTIHGVLYKSDQWSYEVFFGHKSEDTSYNFPNTSSITSYDNDSKSETWASFEVKYPDYEDEKIDWSPLYNAIKFTAQSTDNEFASSFETYFDYPVVRDYYLFIELMLATDNHGKNMFYGVYDTQDKKQGKKLTIAPWDLDGTWGRRWDGSSYYTSANQDFLSFLNSNEHGQLSYFIRLATSSTDNYMGWTQSLKDRYAELRKTYFAEDALIERFTDYAGLFSESHADTREQNKWSSYHSGIQSDVTYIESWIKQRLAYLDEQYGYDATSGISTVTDKKHVGVTGGAQNITLHVDQPTTVSIYTTDGRLYKTLTAQPGLTTVSHLNAGIYIVNGTKVIVK